MLIIFLTYRDVPIKKTPKLSSSRLFKFIVPEKSPIFLLTPPTVLVSQNFLCITRKNNQLQYST